MQNKLDCTLKKVFKVEEFNLYSIKKEDGEALFRDSRDQFSYRRSQEFFIEVLNY